MTWEWHRLLPSPEPRPDDERESIWTVRVRDRSTYFVLVYGGWLVALGGIGYNALAGATADGWSERFMIVQSVVVDLAQFGVGWAILAMLLTRPLNVIGGAAMTLYQAMANRFVVPVIERHKAIGREEGREQGLEAGRAEREQEWRAWYERRLQERQGRPFDEPPPGT